MKAKTLIILSFLALTFSNCSYDSESDLIISEEEPIDPNGGSAVNYVRDIKPIMENSCTRCHASPPVNGAPFSLINFEQVSQRATNILTTMNRQSGAAGAMPPSGRLPQATIDLIQQWIDEGKPEN